MFHDYFYRKTVRKGGAKVASKEVFTYAAHFSHSTFLTKNENQANSYFQASSFLQNIFGYGGFPNSLHWNALAFRLFTSMFISPTHVQDDGNEKDYDEEHDDYLQETIEKVSLENI